MQFSANLGFLWTELALPDAIRAAKQAGFDAVECHWPYAVPSDAVKAALEETGLTMLGLNTQRGDVAAGDNGVAAIKSRQDVARGYIDEAIAYARAIDCGAVHVMAGFTDRSETAEACFRSNLTYACEAAPEITILIEPLNRYDAPGYHVSTLDQALDTIAAVDRPNLKAMFDCYHLQIMQGDLLRRVGAHLDLIGHIQFAAVPDRSEPDQGEIDYAWLLPAIAALGWNRPFGAEYKPRQSTQAGLAWMKHRAYSD